MGDFVVMPTVSSNPSILKLEILRAENTNFSFESTDSSDRLLATPIFRGLELLHFVYSKIKDNDQLIMVTEYSMIRCFCGFPGRSCHFSSLLRWELHHRPRKVVSLTESWADWAIPMLE
jgi:hypothetical protein